MSDKRSYVRSDRIACNGQRAEVPCPPHAEQGNDARGYLDSWSSSRPIVTRIQALIVGSPVDPQPVGLVDPAYSAWSG